MQRLHGARAEQLSASQSAATLQRTCAAQLCLECTCLVPHAYRCMRADFADVRLCLLCHRRQTLSRLHPCTRRRNQVRAVGGSVCLWLWPDACPCGCACRSQEQVRDMVARMEAYEKETAMQVCGKCAVVQRPLQHACVCGCSVSARPLPMRRSSPMLLCMHVT